MRPSMSEEIIFNQTAKHPWLPAMLQFIAWLLAMQLLAVYIYIRQGFCEKVEEKDQKGALLKSQV